MTREPVQIRDILDEDIYQSRIRDIIIRLGFRSLLAVPLLREDHLLGGLIVNRNSPGGFTPQVVDLLEAFATQSALAIHNAHGSFVSSTARAGSSRRQVGTRASSLPICRMNCGRCSTPSLVFRKLTQLLVEGHLIRRAKVRRRRIKHADSIHLCRRLRRCIQGHQK